MRNNFVLNDIVGNKIVHPYWFVLHDVLISYYKILDPIEALHNKFKTNNNNHPKPITNNNTIMQQHHNSKKSLNASTKTASKGRDHLPDEEHWTQTPAPKPSSKKEKETTNGRSSRKGKRTTKSPSPPPSPKATPWFSEKHYKAPYKFNYAKNELIQHKFLSLQWLKSQGFVFLELIEYHGLKKLMEMKGTYYPKLVRVFYTTTHIDGDIGFLCVKVKGKHIVMILEVWEEDVGLSFNGMMENDKGLKDVGLTFNKITKYKNLMMDPSTYTIFVSKGKGKERFGTNPLLLEHRLLAYMFAWIITPSEINHAQLIEEDLLLINLMQG
ncbi:hypothetical protein JHK87_009892 [Glycine soja]|nr:hypothetical protein JHK87_009892 [Glycine soja]